MANVAKHEEQLVIEHVPIGDLRPDPNTTRESCFMAPLQTGGRPKKSLATSTAGRATKPACALPD